MRGSRHQVEGAYEDKAKGHGHVEPIGRGVYFITNISETGIENSSNYAYAIVDDNGGKGLDVILTERPKGHEDGYIGKYGEEEVEHSQRN